jgi:uncharacterized protein YbbC (DUF1343 family)/CubicO group peptidase (beta-lactamase class C family)
MSCATTTNLSSTFDPAVLREIDQTIEQAIAAHKLPGGVFHLERNGVFYEKAYGNRSLVPDVEPMTADTIFDAASLTKVMATTPSIWLLIQRGKIHLDDPVRRYLPEFHDNDVTIRHLLTHTSSLRPDLDLDPWTGEAEGIRRALAEEPVNRPGCVFRYSDINFILLGEIVRRVSGERLDAFAQHEIYEPLGMRDTRFHPTLSNRIAPTEMTPEGMLRGVVHDPTARRMGGVAGHAGLFTTIHDVSIYARMLLNHGRPLFRPDIVEQMTTVQSPPNVAVRRTGGWDLDSGFSRPRGYLFPIGSYGHTGFTGGFLWIDPYSKTFYAFLSNRVHPNGKGSVTALQVALGTLAARAVRGFDFEHFTGGLPPRAGGKIDFITGGADASNAIDVLVTKRYAPLRGMRIGLITNHTGIDRSGNPTIDLLRSAPGVKLVALFSPEHGIRGTANENVSDTTDPVSGLPVHSLYGKTRKPLPEQLAGLDALVYDIQDVGARFYTYISTLGLAMEAAADAKVKFIILDRVDPIGGAVVEGPLRHGEGNDFIAWHDIPIRYGMTAGELAKMYRDERHIDVDLEVLPVTGWKREWWQDESGLPWIHTSPAMRSLRAAGLYPGLGILESAISTGRGTSTPFEIAGAPWIDGNRLAAELSSLPGLRFKPIHFTPAQNPFAGQECGGVSIEITDRCAYRPVAMGVAIATALQRLYPDHFKVDQMEHLLRDPRTIEAIRSGKPPDWTEDERAFDQRRAKFLMY